MSLDEEFTIYTVIEEGYLDYKLSALLTKEGKYTMASLSFSEELWDNTDYLYNILLPLLEKVVNNEKLNALETKELEEINNFITSVDYEIVYKLLKKGVNLGFFNEFQHESK